MASKGCSTGLAPIHVKTINIDLNNQKFILDKKLNFEVSLLICLKGKIIIIKIDKTKATTPPNLLGMERKIAYANKKYHSGWIWMGVLRGLATLKFSGSPIEKGKIRAIKKKQH